MNIQHNSHKLVFIVALLAGCSDDVSQNAGQNQPNSENVIRDLPDAGRMLDGGMPSDDGMARDGGTTRADAAPDMPIILPDQMCSAGEVLGCADDQSVIACNDQTMKFEPRACAAGERCLPGVGCTDMVCEPSSQACEGAESYKVCAADGKSYGAPIACEEGTLCTRGGCVTQCELGKYQSSYVGCEYWTLDLDQYTDPTTNPKPDEVPHAVVISNPGTQPATVTFRATEPGISINVPDPIVPPNSSRAFTMPRLDISGTGITTRSIRVSSSVPVTAHQFSPLNNEGVYSNDASLLLPTNMLGVEYYVVGWPTAVLPPFMGFMPEDQHGYVTILATSPGETFVNVTPKAQIAPSATGEYGVPPGVTRSFSLRYGEVLNLEANSGQLIGPNDLTGTHIKASKPIAVFSGHEEAVVKQPGTDKGCCADHLEQQLFPLKDWGNRYIATFSPGRGEKVDHWRIVAGEDGVVLNTNPPQPGANGVTLGRGEFVSFFSGESFEINATGKVLVGQILVSQQQTSEGTGDPALTLSVPIERFRSDYILLTPSGYSSDYVVITREAGEVIRLNGQPVPDSAFVPVGTGAYEVAEVAVSAGVQSLEATKPFGIAAYGFDRAVSYGYPGGLNLVGMEVMEP